MLIYLDMCCLKRPFDDQSQPRIRLESEAVLALLSAESNQVRFVRSPALHLENTLNPVPIRAARVARWLGHPAPVVDPASLELRTRDIVKSGVNGDALGWVNAVRFIQQYESSRLDYTLERSRILPEWTPDHLLGRLHEIASEVPKQAVPRP